MILAPPADRLVHALKYGGWPELAGEMAALMIREGPFGRGAGSDAVVVPVPTTPGRLRVRGYNQARVLAAELARITECPLVDALLRPGVGQSQISLQPGERRANVEGAFVFDEAVRGQVEGRPVLLVDDVLTTGATAAAAATALRTDGPTSVDVLTFARALPERAGSKDLG